MNYDTDLQRTEYRLPRFLWVDNAAMIRAGRQTGSQTGHLFALQHGVPCFWSDVYIASCQREWIWFLLAELSAEEA